MSVPETQNDPFLEEAERRGLMTAAQVAVCRRIAEALAEVQVEMKIDEVASRKGFLSLQQAGEVRRAISQRHVGRYEVIARLGEGAAGVVWKARDTKLDRVVALKVLSQKAQSVPAFRDRFVREARIAVTLNHVSIVRGLDYGEADGYHYFAMEFVEGENAEQRLARVGRIPEKEALTMGREVVAALQHVQKFQIVHQDIKPGNLLIATSGHVKLGDLGLAKPMLSESELIAGDGSTAGTPFYMSPEQIREPDKVDWRSDVYSLGATLYHLLTGVPPFRPDGKSSVLQKHVHDMPANPREHALDVSDAAASVVMRMLQKAPQDRYESLELLAADLDAVREGRPPLHSQIPVPPEAVTAERHARHAVARRITEKHLPRERFPWAALAAFAVFAAAIAAGWFILNSKKPPFVPPAPPQPGEPPRPDPPKPAPAPVPDTPRPPASDVPPEVERQARLRWAEIRDAAQLDATEGRFLRATTALREFAESREFSRTTCAEEARRTAERYDTRARERFDEVVATAKRLAEQRRYDEAISKVEEAARIETSWSSQELLKAKSDITTLCIEIEQRRQTQLPAYEKLYGRALSVAGRDGVEAARAIVERDEKSLPNWKDEVSSLRDDLDVIAKHGTDPGSIDDSTRGGALAMLLARLTRGELDKARHEAGVLGEAGGDADAARLRIARVEATLKRDVEEILARAEAGLSGTPPRLEEVSRLVDEANDLLPGHPHTLLILARVRFAQNELDQALSLLQTVLARRSAPAEAHLRIAQVLKKKGDDLARAESEVQRFLDAAADGDPLRAQADADLREIRAKRFAGEVKAWRERAKAAAFAGRREVAEGAWSRVVEISPDDFEALMQLGGIYRDTRQLVPAALLYRHAAEVAPSKEQRKAATDIAARIAGVPPTAEDGRAIAADAAKCARREDWSSARKWYRNALTASPYLVSARFDLIRASMALFRDLGEPDFAKEAQVHCDWLIARFGDVASEGSLAFARRSEAQLAMGRTQEALADAAKAVQLDTKSGPALLALGFAQLAVNDPGKAADALRASNLLDPTPQALLGLTRALIARGDLAAARTSFDEFRERYGSPRSMRTEIDEVVEALTRGK